MKLEYCAPCLFGLEGPLGNELRHMDMDSVSPENGRVYFTGGEDALARHPHISRQEAHGIVLYRRHHAPENCTLEALLAAGVLSADHAAKLSRCRIAPAR